MKKGPVVIVEPSVVRSGIGFLLFVMIELPFLIVMAIDVDLSL